MSRAVLYHETGGPEVLRVEQVEDPVPGPGKVAVRVRAAGINPFDAKARAGIIALKTAFPRRIGSDFAGTVEAVGEGADYPDGSPVAVGDEVAGRAAGSHAERVIAAAEGIARRPDAVPPEVAGGLNVPGLTALSMTVTVPIGPEDTVLVGGATGAVGLIVCQLAASSGARVIGTASPRHHDFLRGIGVQPVAYGPGLADRIRAMTDSITAVNDCHGREALDAGVELGVPVERICSIAGGAAIEELGVLPAERDARTAQNLAGLLDRFAAGELTMPVAATFGLAAVADAYRAVESSHDPGKIILLP